MGRQPHVQGEQQGRPPNLLVYSRRQPHVQGEQQGSDTNSSDTVDLPIALRKGTREVARKALQTTFDDHDIGNSVL